MAVDLKSLRAAAAELTYGDYPYPTLEAVARIILATRVPPALPTDEARKKICFAVHNYAAAGVGQLSTKYYHACEVSDGERLLKSIDELEKQLQTAFAINVCEGDALRHKAALADNLEALKPLVAARLEAAKLRKKMRPRRRQDTQNILLIKWLLDAYEAIFDKIPRLSRGGDGKPSGPMLRFLRATINEIGAEMTDEAIATLVSRIRKKKVKPNFLVP